MSCLSVVRKDVLPFVPGTPTKGHIATTERESVSGNPTLLQDIIFTCARDLIFVVTKLRHIKYHVINV